MSIDFCASLRLGRFGYAAEFAGDREIVVMFGPSGAGKSITLQAVAGLQRPDAGRIVVDGLTVFDSEARIDLPPQQRNVGYVVQDLALFPQMTVAENVAFGIPKGAGRRARTEELLDLFGITEFGGRLPRTLSGGQQQRVALARALGRDARVLLLDEPFSALDDSLRSALRRELLRLRADLGLTILFVTHDLREAHLLADRIAVFDDGKILQVGLREEVFRRPKSRRVAALTGVANVFSATVLSCEPGRALVDVQGLVLACDLPPGAPMPPGGEPVHVAVRAERVNLRRVPPGGEPPPNSFAAHITEEYAYGSSHTLRLEPAGAGPSVEVEIAARPYEVLGVASQKQWVVEMAPADLHIMRMGDSPTE